MEKEIIKKQLFLNMFELLMEQGLLSEEENDRLKIMLNAEGK